MPMGFGNPTEWAQFNAEFPEFAARYEALQQTIEKVFVRSGSGNKVDHVVFALGRVCFEDFQQALILCGNGFGIGALQLLRGMYEREVTAAYLSKNPEDTEDFLDYNFVHMRKAVNHLRDALGSLYELHKLVPPEKVSEIERDYSQVRNRFMETLCNKCHSKRPMFSWTKHHTGILAQRGSEGLKQMYFYWYYRPTLLSHSTTAALTARMKMTEEGGIFFDGEAQQNYVKEALVGIHHLMLYVLDTQNEHFRLGLDDEIQALAEDFNACWGKSANMEQAHAEAAHPEEAYQPAGGRDISQLREIITEIYNEGTKDFNWKPEQRKIIIDRWTTDHMATMDEAGILTEYLDMPPDEAKENLKEVLIHWK
jgi:hypothetical protein